ncbi:MAG: EAL domain-containing protein [Coriobacteriales bacterium]
MLKSHENFHSRYGKRLVLVADDEFVNRELLRTVLQDEYELLFAENGREALDAIAEHKETLSLVLLDLLMPVMSGMDVLREVRGSSDPDISRVPIIVVTSDQAAEIESLTQGASDFIPKPYPQPGVVKARINRTIELSEDRQIISSTERDDLTGLYNREYFYRYAEQYDHHHTETSMDAIVVDVNHFRMINERFGTARGDEVLRRLATALRDEVNGIGGIVCRREADIFLVYCPHGLDYDAILERLSEKVPGEGGDSRVWLRMGVYENVDRTMEVERRFDRAKMAADKVQGSFTSRIGMYDDDLHKHELFQEQLIEDFGAAIAEHQFQVYYQPKFDVRGNVPALGGAEALVRWIHPTLGMVSPGEFIPLFEENGLIQNLDLHVWRETAAQIREWHDRFGYAVPVSVNVSRVDMYDPNLVESILGTSQTTGWRRASCASRSPSPPTRRIPSRSSPPSTGSAAWASGSRWMTSAWATRRST